MYKKRRNNLTCIWLCAAAAYIFLLPVQAQQKASVAPPNRYEDKNGYFIAFPPSGWNEQTYPSETIRTKVDFQQGDVGIRIIAGPLPSGMNTLDDLYAENKRKVDGILPQRSPSGSTFSIDKGKKGGRDALIMVMDISGEGPDEVVMFVNAPLWYSIALRAPTRDDLEKHRAIFEHFLDTFVLLDSKKQFSDEEKSAVIVSKYVSIFNLYKKMGNMEEARRFLQEGIALCPNSKELRELDGAVPQESGVNKEPAPAAASGEQNSAATSKAKQYRDDKFGFSFEIPADVVVCTPENPGSMAARISSETPLWLVSSSFELERVNVKVLENASEEELDGMKSMLLANESMPLKGYKRVSVNDIKIGKQGDKRAIEHIHILMQNPEKKLRQLTFLHSGRAFSFTCSTTVERYDNADRTFFDPLFKTMVFK